MSDGAGAPAVSIRQPWVDHILDHTKRIENRGWRTRHRGVVLLHASRAIARGAPWPEYPEGHRPETGAIVGAAQVVDVLALDEALARYPAQARWATGPWCWILRWPVRLPRPLPCRGMPGLFPPALDPRDLAWLRAFLAGRFPPSPSPLARQG